MSYINIARIYPRLDWDNDIGKWTLREKDLEKLECEAEDPESLRKKGEWKNGVCTNCQFDLRCLTDGESDLEQWVWDEGFDFCPNCGADMRGNKNGC